jgi:SAM-dependent methyltransferase
MLEQLRAAVPGVPALVGTAEQIPLGDGTVDAVLVAQAWHWVDPEPASADVARVLAPGGRLGLVWNARDERLPWVAELGRLMRGGAHHDLDNPVVLPPFTELERFDMPWSFELDTARLLDLVTSRSYIIGMSESERAGLLERVRTLAERELERTGAERLSMPYVTQSFRAHPQGA